MPISLNIIDSVTNVRHDVKDVKSENIVLNIAKSQPITLIIKNEIKMWSVSDFLSNDSRPYLERSAEAVTKLFDKLVDEFPRDEYGEIDRVKYIALLPKTSDSSIDIKNISKIRGSKLAKIVRPDVWLNLDQKSNQNIDLNTITYGSAESVIIKCHKCLTVYNTTIRAIISMKKLCKVCDTTTKYTLKDCHIEASKREGRCLSVEYKTCNEKMEWICKDNHNWSATFNNIKHGSWCPKCYGKIKLTLEECQTYASAHNGKCLSTEYINGYTKMTWMCINKHQWNSAFSAMKGFDTWCPFCAGKAKHTIEECRDVAVSRGGKCHSIIYIDANRNLEWECDIGHRWNASFGHVNSGSWCGRCSGSIKLTLDECQQYAINMGGKCLSTKYIDMTKDMQWECKEGHKWQNNFHNIKHNGKKWCIVCRGIKHKIIGGIAVAEKRCTARKFTINNCIEIAAQRDGKCLSTQYINNADLMLWECKKGHKWESSFHKILYKHFLCPDCDNEAKYTLDDCNKWANSLEGKCLSSSYTKCKEYLSWECKEGHQWLQIFTGGDGIEGWCPICSRLSLESYGVRNIRKYLNNLNIQFETEITLPIITGCYRRYDFSFVHKGVKYILEFDGSQHFYESNVWHKKVGSFEYNQTKDRTKTYCAIVSGYSVIRIQQKHYLQIETFLNKVLLNDAKQRLYLDNLDKYEYILDIPLVMEDIIYSCSETDSKLLIPFSFRSILITI